MEPKERSKHTILLGADLGAEVILSPNPPFLSDLPFNAYAEKGRVVFQGYHGTNSDYYTVLHELGHIYHNHVDVYSEEGKWYDKNPLEGEAQAWVWAFNNAEEEMSLRTKEFILSEHAFGSYVKDVPTEKAKRGINYWKVMETLSTRIEYAFD